jgi:dTDP-4-amino-4,6-dideoxygalactose transaminase
VKIPLVDLRAQHAAIRPEIDAAIATVLDRGDFILGESVAAFERAFARWVGARHALGVGSGTDAVEIALRAAGVEAGDEVLVPANTFVASAIGCLRAGATPVFVDCDERTHLLDLSLASRRVTPRTKAVLAVHLFGRLFDPVSLRDFASSHRLRIVEDAAQAHGARSPEGSAGTIGTAAAWSFYPSKNLGAAGDAGAVTTGEDEAAERIAAFRNYGSRTKHDHPAFGVNSRLDSLQAAILGVKLRHLDAWNGRRRTLAAGYRARLGAVSGIRLPEDPGAERHAWHLFVIRVARRDAALRALRDAGIGAAIHYPTPVPLLGAFTRGSARKEGDFPVATRLSREILSLPLYPEMTEAHLDVVCDRLSDAVRD